MKLSVIGTGYVGLVSGACFAEMGNTVVCLDTDAARVETLRAGKVPFYEPGLAELVASNSREGRLHFTGSHAEAIADAQVHFIAVGTPPGEDGSAELRHVLEAARQVGRHAQQPCVVVDKSTVPVGTAEQVRAAVGKELAQRKASIRFDVVSNPEFLKEGAAVNDFMRPERVVIGTDSAEAAEVMRQLYAPFTRNHERLLMMGVRDAELTKYAANAMLATRISFMNELAHLCERLGVDVENVRRGIGSDSRIGHAFLYPGCGYGGSCFPKDMNALIHMAESNGLAPGILRAVAARNHAQKQLLHEKIRGRFGARLAGRVIAVWGLAFKPGTDDIREAPAVELIDKLIADGATVRAYDPVAMDSARRTLPKAWQRAGGLEFAASQYEALAGADALALTTEWKPFRQPDFGAMKKTMKSAVIFDGRNQYDPKQVRAAGFEYFGIGR